MSLAPGGSVLYDEPLALDRLRNDLIFYSVPYDEIVATVCPEAKLRKLVKNMVYVGVVAQLLEIEMGEVVKAIRKQFAKKVKAANLNLAAAQAGFEYSKANLRKRSIYIERMNKTAGKIISTATQPRLSAACVCRMPPSSPGIPSLPHLRWSRR